MSQELIDRLLDDDSSLTYDELVALDEQYPYFTLPAMLLLKRHDSRLDDNRREALRARLAVASADKKALFDLVAPAAADTAGLGNAPNKKPDLSTENAIDTFLSNYGNTSDEEVALLERLIFNPMPDYAEILADEADNVDLSATDTEPDSQDAMIDAFIKSQQKAAAPRRHIEVAESDPSKPKAPVNAPTVSDDSLLSESLAKIFIKQGRYERAHEIIYNLSLKYPKKSIYFADQLRFLQKLIKIQKLKASRQAT